MNIIEKRGTHAQQLERWFGAEQIANISKSMEKWYGPPIPVWGVEGRVVVGAGGDFRGEIVSGKSVSALDAITTKHRIKALNREISHLARQAQANVGFTSLSDLIAALSSGQFRDFSFQKTGTTKVVGVTNTLWTGTGQPAAGGAASAAPGGRQCTDATTGAIPYANPGGTDTLHFVTAEILSSQAGATALLYDRLFDVAKTMASTANEAVTGVPLRYQSTTPTDPDWAGGNFLAIEVATALPATAHNWDALYTDQDGNASQVLPTVTGNASAIINRMDHPTNSWYCPLAAGDQGMKALTRMTCSASVATGAINFMIGHPIAMLPCPVANMMFIRDGINSGISLARIFDDACLSLLEISAVATGAATYSLQMRAAYS
jgi:hypothetical protein